MAVSEISPEYGMISRTLDMYPNKPWTAETLSRVIVNKMWSRSPMTDDQLEDQFDWVSDKVMLREAVNLAIAKGAISNRTTYYMSAAQRRKFLPSSQETLD